MTAKPFLAVILPSLILLIHILIFYCWIDSFDCIFTKDSPFPFGVEMKLDIKSIILLLGGWFQYLRSKMLKIFFVIGFLFLWWTDVCRCCDAHWSCLLAYSSSISYWQQFQAELCKHKFFNPIGLFCFFVPVSYYWVIILSFIGREKLNKHNKTWKY